LIPRLHEVLNLVRPMVGIDLETTGVNAQTDAIVELALEIMAPNHPVMEYRTLVNPLLPIPAGATAVHGITNEMVQGAPTFRQLAENLSKHLVDCDFVGYNVRFDLRQAAVEFQRCAIDWNYENARVIDGFRIWQLAEGRKLADAARRWLEPDTVVNAGEIIAELDSENRTSQQHTALFDVKQATRVVAAQLQACPHLPRDLNQLHELQWPGYFDSEGKLRWNDQDELCMNFGIHKDKPLRYVPNRYILDFICQKDFSDLVKETCRNATKGIFEVRARTSRRPDDAEAGTPF